MKILCALLLSAAAYGTPITASAPIPVTGGGTFSWENTDHIMGGWNASFSGSNGTDSVFANIGTIFGTPNVTLSTTSIILNGFGTWGINGIGGFGQIIFFIHGDGTAHLDGFVTTTGITGTADSIGYLKVTSLDPGQPLTETNGAFTITPTPEPSMSFVVLGGLLTIFSARRARSKPTFT